MTTQPDVFYYVCHEGRIVHVPPATTQQQALDDLARRDPKGILNYHTVPDNEGGLCIGHRFWEY